MAQHGRQCPACNGHNTKIVDLTGEGDDLSIVMGCDDCQHTFTGEESQPKPDAGDPWWLELSDDFERHFADYLAQFSGE